MLLAKTPQKLSSATILSVGILAAVLIPTPPHRCNAFLTFPPWFEIYWDIKKLKNVSLLGKTTRRSGFGHRTAYT